MQEITVGKKYRHYKGNVYKIIALGRHSETLEDMVVYQSVETGEVWVRPKSMWNEVIETPHPRPLSHKGRGENCSEVDLALQDKPVEGKLSTDNRSTCVALRFTLL